MNLFTTVITIDIDTSTAQVDPQNTTSTSRVKKKRGDYVKTAASLVLGPDFEFDSPNTLNDITGLAIYDELDKVRFFVGLQL